MLLGTFDQHMSALRFLYQVTLRRDWAVERIPLARQPRRLPVVLSLEEVGQFMASLLRLKHRAMLLTAYSAGLRVSDVAKLKLTDIDSQRMMIRIEQGKGKKDRYVMLSPRLPEGVPALGDSQVDHRAHAAALLCHPPAGGRH